MWKPWGAPRLSYELCANEGRWRSVEWVTFRSIFGQERDRYYSKRDHLFFLFSLHCLPFPSVSFRSLLLSPSLFLRFFLRPFSISRTDYFNIFSAWVIIHASSCDHGRVGNEPVNAGRTINRTTYRSIDQAAIGAWRDVLWLAHQHNCHEDNSDDTFLQDREFIRPIRKTLEKRHKQDMRECM